MTKAVICTRKENPEDSGRSSKWRHRANGPLRSSSPKERFGTIWVVLLLGKVITQQNIKRRWSKKGFILTVLIAGFSFKKKMYLDRKFTWKHLWIVRENRHGSYIFTWFLLNTWRAVSFSIIMSGYQMWVSLTSLMMCPALWRAFNISVASFLLMCICSASSRSLSNISLL